MATLATPGIAINRGRIVHFARIVRSICESVLDDTPILSSRLVDDSGERITGCRAAVGSRAASTASRSCTTWRAAIRSVPSLRINTTDESPSTDFDRIVLRPIVPLSAFSSGTLIRLSTSSVERPGASVWTSIKGGANSGKTSSGAFRGPLDAHDHEHDRQRQHHDPQAKRGGDNPVHHERSGPTCLEFTSARRIQRRRARPRPG